MSHLNEVGRTYFQHLFYAWKYAFILLVHGLFPDIWKTKASDELCKERIGDNATRAHMLKHMYGIIEKKYKEPSIYDRLSDRELAIMMENNKINK